MVHVRLTAVGHQPPGVIDRTPADPVEFWEQSRVHDPRPIRVNREWESLGGPSGVSSSSRATARGRAATGAAVDLVATAHIRQAPGPAPFVLLLHGYAVPADHVRPLARQADAPPWRAHGSPRSSEPPEAHAPGSAQRRRVLQPRSGAHPRSRSASRSKMPPQSSPGLAPRSPRTSASSASASAA